MAARTPRRSFAAPFVVTLAAAPACYVQPAPQQPVHPVQSAPSQPSTPPPTGPGPGPVVVNPPRPQPDPQTQPAPVEANQKWTVFKSTDGSGCMAAIKVECQPKTACNPPPPFKYECPTNVTLDSPVTVAATGDGTACFVEYAPIKCPPNVACNPPRPTQVACPRR